MRTKRAFVPSSLGGIDRLESRVVLSTLTAFSRGAAVLTDHAYGQTAGEIRSAFVRFATHGQDFGRLNADLGRAIARIPYHNVDGLSADMQGVVSSMRADMVAGAPNPVANAYQSAIASLNSQVQARVADGSVVRNGLSGGVAPPTGTVFAQRAAVLTGHAYAKTVGEIRSAFARFATHGQDAGRLNADLGRAIARIPYHNVDGMNAGMGDIVTSMRADMAAGVPNPVGNAYQSAIASLNAQIQSRVADGSVVFA